MSLQITPKKDLSFSISDASWQDSLLLNQPYDIALEIRKHLNLQEWVGLTTLCKRSWILMNDEGIWKKLLDCDFPGHSTQISHHFVIAYKTRYLIHHNMDKTVYRSDGFVKLHTRPVCGLIHFNGSLISGAYDHTIKIWNINQKTYIGTLEGHQGAVICLAILNGKLASGSKDKTIKIWELSEKKCLQTLRGHLGDVTALIVHNEKLISGSSDGTIKIWDWAQNACLATFDEHRFGVNSLAVSNGKLFSGEGLGTIRVWDLETHKSLDSLSIAQPSLWSMVTAEDKLFVGGGSGIVEVLDARTNTPIESFELLKFPLSSLIITEGKLIAGFTSGAIVILDLKSKACIGDIAQNKAVTTSLVMSAGKLFAGMIDHSIQIWDFTASDQQVFEELAGLFASGKSKNLEQAMQRFSRMPKAAKNRIYAELYKIIQPQLIHDYWGCAEHAFQGQHGQSSTPKQKAQAIRNYLEKQI